MAINQTEQLHNLDFTTGVRSQQLNDNFNLLKKWIEAERLRIGGWGLVEGFELTKDLSDFSIHVSVGVLVNEEGQEVKVDEYKFIAGPPVYKELTEELTVGAEGVITLSHPAYSNIQKHTIIYDPPNHSELSDEELKITLADSGLNLTVRDIRFVDENMIIINSDYAGRRVRVNYLYANDRIDAILLKKDGSEYIYEIGIISTSPSQQVIQDYLNNGYYLIGFAYWHVGKEVDVQFITVDRTLRPIYIDENNNLYLNGVLYTGNKFIYFVEPDHPQQNDIWYDVDNEILYIWRPNKDTGEYEWKAINDLSKFVRDYGVFTLEENPDDLQTFTFENKQNLRFIPGQNALTIIIDQVVLMRDQYEELTTESQYDDNVVTGYGFKLLNPLERPSIIEVYVDHSVYVQNGGAELFSHVSAFIDTNTFTINEDKNAPNDFECKGQYEIGNNQLEVWLNGIRLNYPSYIELKEDSSPATTDDNGSLSTKFRVNINLKAEDSITYKITRQMATYDNFKAVTDSLNDKVTTAVKDLNEAQIEFDNLVNNIGDIIDKLEESNTQLQTSVEYLEENAIDKNKGAMINDLHEEVRSKLAAGTKYITQSAINTEITLQDMSVNDFISIYWIKDLTRLILVKDSDYEITATENGIIISLSPDWIDESANIYIEAITLGV